MCRVLFSSWSKIEVRYVSFHGFCCIETTAKHKVPLDHDFWDRENWKCSEKMKKTNWMGRLWCYSNIASIASIALNVKTVWLCRIFSQLLSVEKVNFWLLRRYSLDPDTAWSKKEVKHRAYISQYMVTQYFFTANVKKTSTPKLPQAEQLVTIYLLLFFHNLSLVLFTTRHTYIYILYIYIYIHTHIYIYIWQHLHALAS